METMTMLCTASALLAVAAIGGLGMAAIRFGKGRNPPAAFAMVHGLLVDFVPREITVNRFDVGGVERLTADQPLGAADADFGASSSEPFAEL